MKKKAFVIFTLLCMVAQGAQALVDPYDRSCVEYVWSGSQQTYVSTQSWIVGEFTEIDGVQDAEGWRVLNGDYKWYIFKGNVTYKTLQIVGKNVHIVLNDGCTVNLKHIKLETGATLHIHGQKGEKGAIGKLVVNNDAYDNAAGIGGGDEANSGNLYIHGGDITATGGSKAAAIGGGQNGSIGGSVTIYDGTVTATSKSNGGIAAFKGCGAAIGGGDEGSQGGPINIHGGTVTATATYDFAAAIGGGHGGASGDINITGCTVMATAGSYGCAIGIGAGGEANGQTSVTGGTVTAYGGFSGTVYIANATVIAASEENQYYEPFHLIKSLTFGDYMCVRASYSLGENFPTYIKLENRVAACELLTESRYYRVKIAPCDEHHFVDYACEYCGYNFYDGHDGTWVDEGIRAKAFSAIDEGAKTITICSAAELGLLAYNVDNKSPNEDYQGWTVKLGCDIDMTDHSWTANGEAKGFAGTFDGQGHTIRGLHNDTGHTRNAGLLGVNHGTVKNVVIASSVFYGTKYVGAVVGNNCGRVENCRVASDVAVILTGNEQYKACGGVVGCQVESTDAATQCCYSEASVKGTSRDVRGEPHLRLLFRSAPCRRQVVCARGRHLPVLIAHNHVNPSGLLLEQRHRQWRQHTHQRGWRIYLHRHRQRRHRICG